MLNQILIQLAYSVVAYWLFNSLMNFIFITAACAYSKEFYAQLKGILGGPDLPGYMVAIWTFYVSILPTTNIRVGPEVINELQGLVNDGLATFLKSFRKRS